MLVLVIQRGACQMQLGVGAPPRRQPSATLLGSFDIDELHVFRGYLTTE